MVADAAVSPAEGLVTALHVGITLSSVHEMTLGGIGGRFHHTVNGPACLDLERLVSAARPDHVCVNDAAWALLRAAGAAAVDVAAPGSAPVWELESIPAEAPPHERALWRSPRSTTDMLPPEKDRRANAAPPRAASSPPPPTCDPSRARAAWRCVSSRRWCRRR